MLNRGIPIPNLVVRSRCMIDRLMDDRRRWGGRSMVETRTHMSVSVRTSMVGHSEKQRWEQDKKLR